MTTATAPIPPPPSPTKASKEKPPSQLLQTRRAVTFVLQEVKLVFLSGFSYSLHRVFAGKRSRREPGKGCLSIGMDGRDLCGTYDRTSGPTGLGRYIDELINGLLSHECDLVCRLYTEGPHLKSYPETRYKNLPLRRRTKFVSVLARDLALGRIDLLHISYTDQHLFRLLPLLFAPVGVITIHDVISLTWPGYMQPWQISWYTFLLRWATRHADLVLFNSEFTRADCERALGIEGKATCVSHLGVDPRFHPIECEEELRRVRAKYGLPEQFVLTVGRCAPHKNIPTLARAIGRLRSVGLPVTLVLVGPDDYPRGKQELDQVLEETDGATWMRWPGYVDEEDLPAIYSAARLLAFPSLYEGFGLPILEAMACGTPVVCSNRTSLPEVAGDAALLVDAANCDALADAVCEVWTNDALREQLRTRGLRRARQFTWQAMAEQTVEAYRQAVRSKTK